MLLHKNDLHEFDEALQEMFQSNVNVVQIPISDGEICRIERWDDSIWFSTYTGSLDRPDVEPIELAGMAAHYDDRAGEHAARSKELEEMRRRGQLYMKIQTGVRFRELCDAIMAYYRKYHLENADLIFLYDQAVRLKIDRTRR